MLFRVTAQVCCALACLAAAFSGAAATCHQYSEKIESPCNSVLDKKHGYEIRSYKTNDTNFFTSAYVASSSFMVAAKQGFDKNFAYISGHNSKNETIPMTAPVIFSRDTTTDGWLVGFFVPSKYANRTQVPRPDDFSVSVVALPRDITFAVITFGGFACENDFKDHQHALQKKLRADGVKPVTGAWDTVWASYDSPFVLFNRHNEVWLQVEGKNATAPTTTAAAAASTAFDMDQDIDSETASVELDFLLEGQDDTDVDAILIELAEGRP